MTKANKITWNKLATPEWELEIEAQIEEEASLNWDSIASQWLSPTDPLFAVPDIPQVPELEHSFVDPEYEKIQSVPYNEFDPYWEEKMREQRREANGGNKRSSISTGT
jgi:hypothetical protein